ncbi:MAG: adenine deaminase [Clostridia bacterium]|nr:adenine deaminase [Clostridia bacterium]
MNKERLINAAMMKEKPDLVLKNANILNVFTGEILEGDIAVTDGIIVGIGEYSGKTEKDLKQKLVVPGFINAHVHVESSMVTPEVYAEEELKWGTTTIVTDPHEIANVGGLTALSEILKAAERSKINYYVMLPSCVPSTPFEHSGAVLNAEELTSLKDHPYVLGLGEMMNSVGVLNHDKTVLDKLYAFSDQVIDGHFPLGSGYELNAYVSAGIDTDHESISYKEAAEKLRAGMAVLVREGSASKNLEDIIRGVVESGIDTSHLAFCTDDKHLADIRREGTIRYNIKKSIELGLDPIKAIQIGTINAARIYGLKKTGAIACGYKADMVILDDIKEMKVSEVYKDGKSLSELGEVREINYDERLISPIHFAPLSQDAFVIPEKDTYSVIGIVENQIVTQKVEMSVEEIKSGLSDGSVRKIAVVERHHAAGFHAAAYITGYGLKHGAVASTVAHDSHNIVIIGDNDADMLKAADELKRIGGGYVIIEDGTTVGELPLPLGGLMSLKSAEEFIPELEAVIEKAYTMGVNQNIDPFITLSFMSLPVIPEIRITDCGLFDAERFELIE